MYADAVPKRDTPDRIDGGKAAVLMAVVAGATTWPEVVAATGLARTVVHKHLHRLRDEGLVDFVDGQRGTLRPRLTAVPIP